MTRTVAQKLTERLGHAFIVENRPGASGVIGQDLAAKAAPDGHMLVTVASPLTILPYLMKNLPYKGTGPALVDLLGGRTQFMMANVLSVAHHVEAGKVRALGVSSTRRSAALPNVPPIGESVPGYDVVQWYGVAGLTPQ